MNCVYRNEGTDQGQHATFPFKFLATEKCSNCQVLQTQKAKDTTCYNPELTEKTCNISPQSENSSTS